MALVSAPQFQTQAVSCLDRCVPPGAGLAILISLLAQKLAVSRDTNTLIANARCYECIPGNMRMSVLVSLAQQITGF